MSSVRAPVIVQSTTPSVSRSRPPAATLAIRQTGVGSAMSVTLAAIDTVTIWSVLGSSVTLGVSETMLGAVLSRTVMIVVSVSVLPELLVAEQVTSVAPSGNIDPDAGTHVTGNSPSNGSTAEATKVTIAPAGPVASTRMFFGAVTFGGFGFFGVTVTLKLAEAELPWRSAVEQATAVVPSANTLPDAGTHETGRVPSTRSAAEAVKLTTAPGALVARVVTCGGTVNAGAV